MALQALIKATSTMLLRLQGGRDGILNLLCQKELRAFLVACGLPIEMIFPSKEDGQ